MPLHVRTASSFRQRLTRGSAAPEDFVRSFEDEGVHVVAMANGLDSGFSTCCPELSRLLLDLFVEGWSATRGSVADRLHDAFESARARFRSAAPEYTGLDEDFPEDRPDGSLLVAAFDGAHLHVRWISPDVVFVARRFEVAVRSTPHTLRELAKGQRPDLAHLPEEFPDVVIRTLLGEFGGPSDDLVVELEARDVVVLASHGGSRGPNVPVDEAAFAASAYASPSLLVERLADVGFVRPERPYVSFVALRVDDEPASEERIDREGASEFDREWPPGAPSWIYGTGIETSASVDVADVTSARDILPWYQRILQWLVS